MSNSLLRNLPRFRRKDKPPSLFLIMLYRIDFSIFYIKILTLIVFSFRLFIQPFIYTKMKFATLIKHAAELLRIIRKSPAPADSVASEYLRPRKYIGSSERKIISELVFNTLRTEALVAYFVTNILKINNKDEIKQNFDTLFIVSSTIFFATVDPKASELFLQRLAKFTDTSRGTAGALIDALAEPEMPKLDISAAEFISQLQKLTDSYMEIIHSDGILPPPLLCMNDTVAKELEKRYSPQFIAQLSFSLLKPAPVCLRVNTLKISRRDLMIRLQNYGIESVESIFSPVGMILDGRPNLNVLEEAKNGFFWIQDIGSQLIGYALGAEPGSSILDACAGAGGKTLHIAADLENDAEILASDIEFKRLKEISKRADTAGISCIRTALLAKTPLKEQISRKFDFVITDAPCSGLGTVRRMPMQKWRLTPKLLKRITDAQSEIVDYYSDFVAPGGILLYATCSFLPAENFDIVTKFLESHPDFSPAPIKPVFESKKASFPSLTESDFMLQLTPLDGETDGFFMARMQKKV